MTDDEIRIVQRIFDAWNSHDPDRYIELLDEQRIIESDTLPAPVVGLEASRQFMESIVRAFPDVHFEIDQLFGDGEFGAIRWTLTGTHRGELMGIPPTNRPVVIHGCTIGRLRQGKALHDWLYWDTGTLLRQLGVLPESSEWR
jgi:steroid delta-isomerase-like uncharacterized protein